MVLYSFLYQYSKRRFEAFGLFCIVDKSETDCQPCLNQKMIHPLPYVQSIFSCFLRYCDHFYYCCYYSQHVSLILPLICNNTYLFFFLLLENYLCSLLTLHSQAICNSLENRFSALSLQTKNRTGSGFRLLSSTLRAKKVPVLTKCTAYPLQMFINLQFSVPALSRVVCSGRMAKCCIMSARTGWKLSDHISCKDSAPRLQGDFGQAILSHSP